MTIFSFVNAKGGSAKSTTTFNFSYNLSKQFNILCIDFDDQASLTSMYQKTPHSSYSTYDLVFQGMMPDLDLKTHFKNISLVPADSRLTKIEQSTDFSLPFNARNNIKEISKNYDYTVIDTAGMDGNRLFIALASSDYVLIPLVLDHFNIEAIYKTMNKLKMVHSAGFTNVKLLGIIPSIVKGLVNGVPRQLTEAKIYKELKDEFDNYCMPIITDRASIRKSQSLKLPLDGLPHKDKDLTAEKQFYELTKKIINKANGEYI